MAIGKRVLTIPRSKMVVGKKPSVKAAVQAGVMDLPKSFAPVNGNVFEWTAEKKAIVFNMLKWGLPIEDVATTVGCGVQTLRKYCKVEITHARIHANSKVAEVFYKMAVSGKIPAATMAWMKARVPGFKDPDQQVTINNFNQATTIDVTKLSIEQLRTLESIHTTAKVIEGNTDDE